MGDRRRVFRRASSSRAHPNVAWSRSARTVALDQQRVDAAPAGGISAVSSFVASSSSSVMARWNARSAVSTPRLRSTPGTDGQSGGSRHRVPPDRARSSSKRPSPRRPRFSIPRPAGRVSSAAGGTERAFADGSAHHAGDHRGPRDLGENADTGLRRAPSRSIAQVAAARTLSRSAYSRRVATSFHRAAPPDDLGEVGKDGGAGARGRARRARRVARSELTVFEHGNVAPSTSWPRASTLHESLIAPSTDHRRARHPRSPPGGRRAEAENTTTGQRSLGRSGAVGPFRPSRVRRWRSSECRPPVSRRNRSSSNDASRRAHRAIRRQPDREDAVETGGDLADAVVFVVGGEARPGGVRDLRTTGPHR